jgi:hypothetical protein
MTRTNYLLGGLVVTVAMVLAPISQAQTLHVVGAGSSAQFLTAALGADTLAQTIVVSGSTCSFHYTAKTAANIIDNRDGALIHNEPGNIWIVWVATQDGSSCADSQGGTGITDVWTDISVDSTVGVRTFLAGLSSGSGALLSVNNPPPAPGNLVSPATLWANGNPDVGLPSSLVTLLTNQHINLGLTDIRPEDAAFATARAYSGPSNCTGTGTCTKLGYSSSNYGVGGSIESDLGCPNSCSTSIATPVDFSLSGTDPFTGQPIRAYTTVPIGAAPIVIVYNNNGETSYPTNLKTGITPGKHMNGQQYPLADLFNGTTACNESNAAFDGFSGSANVNVALREPLSGTMNTTEFNLFRTDGNNGKAGSQEWLINPASQGGGYTSGGNYNPADLTCGGGGGKRVRGIGTGEITKWVNTTPNTLGYIFWGFANANSVVGSNSIANYNYFTLDSVDPLSLGTTDQQLPACAGPCPATLWPLDSNNNINSFPTLRDGTYKAWSLYRWLVPNPDSDKYGPTALATATQLAVDVSYADYVPFIPTSTSAGNDPGLGIYRSHRKGCSVVSDACPSGDTINPNNGSFSGGNFSNTLGGGTEAGGDVGGLVYGPYVGGGVQGSLAVGKVGLTKKSKNVRWVAGQKFSNDGTWAQKTIYLDAATDANGVCQGTAYTIASVTSTKKLTLTTKYKGKTRSSDPACTPAAHPGVLSKIQ